MATYCDRITQVGLCAPTPAVLEKPEHRRSTIPALRRPRAPRRVGLLAVLVVSLLFAVSQRAAGSGKAISGVSRSPAFFSPTIGQDVKISFLVGDAGTIKLEIVDRDGFVIRTVQKGEVQPGPSLVTWDGKDDAGVVAPDEAYAPRITFSRGAGSEVYDPTSLKDPDLRSLSSCTYSRSEGILSYTLPWPARVYVQAGQATRDGATGSSNGPVLKTVVDRKPRASGLVVESWNGFDESSRIYVPDLPHFVVGVTYSPLPENAIITAGNRDVAFFEYAQRHRPHKALVARKPPAMLNQHHVGLSALEDGSPRLEVRAAASLNPATGNYDIEGKPLVIALTLDPRRAPYFLRPSAQLHVFVDEELLLAQPARRSTIDLTIPADSLPLGEHRIVFNWASGVGPVAVTAIKVNVAGSGAPAKPAHQ